VRGSDSHLANVRFGWNRSVLTDRIRAHFKLQLVDDQRRSKLTTKGSLQPILRLIDPYALAQQFVLHFANVDLVEVDAGL